MFDAKEPTVFVHQETDGGLFVKKLVFDVCPVDTGEILDGVNGFNAIICTVDVVDDGTVPTHMCETIDHGQYGVAAPVVDDVAVDAGEKNRVPGRGSTNTLDQGH